LFAVHSHPVQLALLVLAQPLSFQIDQHGCNQYELRLEMDELSFNQHHMNSVAQCLA
jgi:hypothetical protein